NTYYYATRDPFGAAGDFTTAPEISQMFGEMVGAALADCWQRAGTPPDAIYVELGPGRGTLAADALQVMRSAGFSGGIPFGASRPCEASPNVSCSMAEQPSSSTMGMNAAGAATPCKRYAAIASRRSSAIRASKT